MNKYNCPSLAIWWKLITNTKIQILFINVFFIFSLFSKVKSVISWNSAVLETCKICETDKFDKLSNQEVWNKVDKFCDETWINFVIFVSTLCLMQISRNIHLVILESNIKHQNRGKWERSKNEKKEDNKNSSSYKQLRYGVSLA